MHDYRTASSKEQLNKVQQFKYDNHFNNFVDPKVLKYFSSTKSMRKAWKKSYGFPYVSVLSGNRFNRTFNNTDCFQKCAHYVSAHYSIWDLLRLLQERSKFAKDCKKNDGFFKCCVQDNWLDIFENSRNTLIEEGLIKDKPTSMCKLGFDWKDPCFTCNRSGQ